MTSLRITDSMEALGDALAGLQEAASEPMDSKFYIREVVVQRFEYTVELFRKTFVKILEESAESATVPNKVIQEANKQGLLHNASLWQILIDLRNETSHMYDKKRAAEIYQLIKTYIPELTHTYRHLQHIVAKS